MPVDELEETLANPAFDEATQDTAPAPLGMRLMPPSTGWVELHRNHRERFAELRLQTAEAFLELPGEIVNGHPDRHVVRVKLPGWPRDCFLKRQHHVTLRERLRQWRAGFGWSSRSVREGRLLRELERGGFPAPQWLAFGEDGEGRAFVLIEELPDCVELRRLLSDIAMSLEERSRLAERLGQAVAELHAAGFHIPDLSAKHVFVNPETLRPTLLDWQRASRNASRIPCDSLALAALDASLGEKLAGARERLRFLRAYRNILGRSTNVPSFSALAREIERLSARLQSRRSLRDQRQAPLHQPDQRLVWLAGEAVCAIPEIAALWPNPAIAAPFYDGPPAPSGDPIAIQLADGRTAHLLRGRSFQPLHRLRAAIRGRPWRSPGTTFGRLLFHLQRYDIPAPRLYAFGQRSSRFATADWFVLYAPPAGKPLDEFLAGSHDASLRQAVMKQIDAIVQRLQAAGCRLVGRRPPFWVDQNGRVMLGDFRAVRLIP